ncbi:hypothetical protein ABID47_005810 [Paenibacillus favisporus]|uniref:Tail fiber protein n=1 Tax=Paenibacillus favisporus TaxID=221028 RepID=A0ABV2FBK0_9BACL
MSSNTPNLGLLKKDPMTDGNETFNIQTMLNDNWDKIDDKVGQMSDELGNITIPDASLTVAGKTMLSNSITGTRENVAATEKAVKLALDKSLSSVPDASLTVAGKTMLSNAINGTRQNVAATEYAVKLALDSVKIENYNGSNSGALLFRVPSQYPTIQAAIDAMPRISVRNRIIYLDAGWTSNVSGNYDADFKFFHGGSVELVGVDSNVSNYAKLTGYGINIDDCTCQFSFRNIDFIGTNTSVNCQSPCYIWMTNCRKVVANQQGDWLWFGGNCIGGVSNVECSNCQNSVIQVFNSSHINIGFVTGTNNYRFIYAMDGGIAFVSSSTVPSATVKYSVSSALVVDKAGPKWS